MLLNSIFIMPVFGMICICFIPSTNELLIKRVALVTSFFTFYLSLFL